MSNLIVAQRKLGADKPANTGGQEHTTSPAPTVVEKTASLVNSAVGSLGELLSGGIHPESGAPTSVDTSLSTSGGKTGRLGGLVPDTRTVADKTGAAAKQTAIDVGDIGKGLWEKIKRL
jgi:hypothetical protein